MQRKTARVTKKAFHNTKQAARTAPAPIIVLGLALLFAAPLAGCQDSSVVENLQEQKLFTLKYGHFENELGFYPNTMSGNCGTGIVMQDGFFFIADSNSQKVVCLNSYGDLVSIIYNKDTNPVPSFLQFSGIVPEVDGTPSANATQRATSFPFTSIGAFALDTRKQLYIVDYLPQERYETDSANGDLLRQIVLRFTENGEYVDYIGQQGSGGSPFPYIKNIYTTANDELVVVCLSTTGNTVYWFSSEGFLKYMVPFSRNELPAKEEDLSRDLLKNLDSIIPDFNQQKLYVKIDYSYMDYDESSKVQSGIRYDKTLLFPLDVTTGLYEAPLTIPAYEEFISTDYNRDVYQVPYQLLGMTESNWMFFSVADEGGYTLLMVQPDGQRMLRRHITVDVKPLIFYNLNLSKNGIVSMLMSSAKETSVSWWRTDEIINAMML